MPITFRVLSGALMTTDTQFLNSQYSYDYRGLHVQNFCGSGIRTAVSECKMPITSRLLSGVLNDNRHTISKQPILVRLLTISLYLSECKMPTTIRVLSGTLTVTIDTQFLHNTRTFTVACKILESLYKISAVRLFRKCSLPFECLPALNNNRHTISKQYSYDYRSL